MAGIVGMGALAAAGVASALTCDSAKGQAQTGTVWKFDFGIGGAASTVDGYIRVGPGDRFSAATGWGWLEPEGLNARDRGAPGPLRRDLVVGTESRTFRITRLAPGRYRLTVTVGDLTYGDHVTQVTANGVEKAPDLPVLRPALAEFATLTATITVPAGNAPLDITFGSPEKNWVVNALSLEPATAHEAARITTEKVPLPEPKSAWGPVLSWPDPTRALIEGHRKRLRSASPKSFKPTGLKRSDYLKLIGSEVDFWKTHQNRETGAIIDPYRKVEFQYSTPAFAHAGAALVAFAGRRDLVEVTAKSLDWAAHSLAERKAASNHEDFYAPMLAHAIRLLKPHVPAARSAAWENDIRRFDPYKTYRSAVGRGGNWNVVAASGEALFQMMGLRDPNSRFVEASFAGQGAVFGSPYGLYLEGPLPYDHFPRLWAADLIARGYVGAYHRELREVLRRASITSLFMQSPWGELPAGGRSAHHQWNEAEQCVTYEIYAARALHDGDEELAGIFKRAANLALGSMRRWVRPSGEMQIVKNWVDPSKAHAFEGYSAHSQYNLLAMSMLATAYEHGEAAQNVRERPAPADVGGYVLEIKELHKVFANAQGTYVELDTAADHGYDATGLIRVHFAGVSPQLGPSDSVLAKPKYRVPAGSPHPPTTGVGVAWRGADGAWHHLGEISKSDLKNVSVETSEVAGDHVSFRVRYEGSLGGGVSSVEEQFLLTPGELGVTTLLPGYGGPVRRVVPLLADDGRTETRLVANGASVMVSQPFRRGSGSQTFTAVGATSWSVGAEKYPNHNGWARLATAEYASDAGNRGVTLVIKAQK